MSDDAARRAKSLVCPRCSKLHERGQVFACCGVTISARNCLGQIDLQRLVSDPRLQCPGCRQTARRIEIDHFGLLSVACCEFRVDRLAGEYGMSVALRWEEVCASAAAGARAEKLTWSSPIRCACASSSAVASASEFRLRPYRHDGVVGLDDQTEPP